MTLAVWWYDQSVGGKLAFDVLVIGSGASGLAAAVSAERAGARVALATKGALQSCNSAKAQGGIQAAFGEDDSPEQHADDVWQSSHETAERTLVEVLTSEASRAKTAATGSRAAAARPASGCCKSATGRGMRSRPHCATHSRAPAVRRFRI